MARILRHCILSGVFAMYKVVLIDDEEIIVQGMQKVIPWEKYGCHVAGTACNGEEGMTVIRWEKPDIVFTDISMPGLNGLQMIAGIKSEFPDLQISILTGYRNFEYAQEAIRLGVVRYLLKPSRMDELEEALHTMLERLKALCPEETQEQEEDREGLGDNAAGSFVVKNALTYIEQHYKEKITLSDVADQVYVSQWHLSKLLNGHLGKSYSEILNTIRIREAKKLLKDPSMRISGITEEVGFVDTAHFFRVFKKITGMSANEYRNSLRREQ